MQELLAQIAANVHIGNIAQAMEYYRQLGNLLWERKHENDQKEPEPLRFG